MAFVDSPGEGSVYVDDGDIVFEETGYYISLGSVTSWEDIVGWSLQLSEKTWVTRDLIRRFIQIAMEQNDLSRPSLR